MLLEARVKPDYAALLNEFPQVDLKTQEKLFHSTQDELSQWIGETYREMVSDCLNSGNKADIPLVGKAINFLSAFLLLGNKKAHQLDREQVVARAAALKERVHLSLFSITDHDQPDVTRFVYEVLRLDSLMARRKTKAARAGRDLLLGVKSEKGIGQALLGADQQVYLPDYDNPRDLELDVKFRVDMATLVEQEGQKVAVFIDCKSSPPIYMRSPKQIKMVERDIRGERLDDKKLDPVIEAMLSALDTDQYIRIQAFVPVDTPELAMISDVKRYSAALHEFGRLKGWQEELFLEQLHREVGKAIDAA